MKTPLDCIPCYFSQALRSAQIAKASEKKQKEIMYKITELVKEFSFDRAPVEFGREIYKIVRETTNVEDPYKEIKEKSNKIAISLYPKLKEIVNKSKDKLMKSIEIAIQGNLIDYGVKHQLKIENVIKRMLNNNLAMKKIVSNYEEFKKCLKNRNMNKILYLADNAGEIIFDRIFIEEIKKEAKEIIFAVRDKPVINDALIEDAVFCELNKTTRIVSTGCDSPGTVLGLCSKEFTKIYKDADLIISKGQGNFEALSNQKRNIFFLLVAKCHVVAKYISGMLDHRKTCRVGDAILLFRK